MSKRLPNPSNVCYDCGSTVPGHHTPRCAFPDVGDTLDLPQRGDTQWWDREAEQPTRTIQAAAEAQTKARAALAAAGLHFAGDST